VLRLALACPLLALHSKVSASKIVSIQGIEQMRASEIKAECLPSGVAGGLLVGL
jgi:hypothetical protein